MNVSNFIRVAGVALVLSTLSFAAGIAGDLSMADPPNYGERVVLRIPPEISTDAVRAAPLPVLSTASAEARPVWTEIRAEVLTQVSAPLVKPAPVATLPARPKVNPDHAAKPNHRRKGG